MFGGRLSGFDDKPLLDGLDRNCHDDDSQGLGEGVALPTMSNLVATHIPKEARARALGLAFSGFHGGGCK